MNGSYYEPTSLYTSYSRLSIGSSHGSSVSCVSPLDSQGPSTCTSAVSEYVPNFNWPTPQSDYDAGSRPFSARSNTIATERPKGEVKRKRGRPRKHPVLVKLLNPDKPKGRSKTGCITCRRRKKKCDETKPTCLNCQKNNAVCEGYHSAGQARLAQSEGTSNIKRSLDLPPLINGVENDTDRFLLMHFNHQLVHILSLCSGDQNPFIEILMPMAMHDIGLMHSLLCLSGCHFMERASPPSLDISEISQRQQHHFDKAVSYLRQRDLAIAHTCAEHNESDDISVAQMMLLCLKTAVNGEHEGEYAIHMEAARHLVRCAKRHDSNSAFQSFVNDFFIYQGVSNALTSLHRRASLLLDPDMDFPRFVQPEAGSYLGILNSIFLYLRKITTLRHQIRVRRNRGVRPPVDFQTLAEAEEINQGLQEWECNEQDGTPRFLASHLYRQCTWIYLHRTVCSQNKNLSFAVDEGLKLLRQLPSNGEMQAILLMPVFLLGCAAFEASQRPEIEKAFDGLLTYRSSGNIRHARSVVQGIWQMMDDGNEDSWDWETLMDKMGLDFLIT